MLQRGEDQLVLHEQITEALDQLFARLEAATAQRTEYLMAFVQNHKHFLRDASPTQKAALQRFATDMTSLIQRRNAGESLTDAELTTVAACAKTVQRWRLLYGEQQPPAGDKGLVLLAMFVNSQRLGGDK